MAGNKTIFLELKTTKGKSLPFGNVRENQVKGMKDISTKDNTSSYFIINFREFEETFAIKASEIHFFYYNGKRKSFPIDWCKSNGILIKQELKRTRYKYNVIKFLEAIN